MLHRTKSSFFCVWRNKHPFFGMKYFCCERVTKSVFQFKFLILNAMSKWHKNGEILEVVALNLHANQLCKDFFVSSNVY